MSSSTSAILIRMNRGNPTMCKSKLPRVLSGALAALLVLLIFSSAAWAAQESVIYNFCSQSGCSDGMIPESALLADKAGNFYGTTLEGGTGTACGPFGESCGVVFELTPKSGGGWTESVLYSFTGEADGGSPYNSLVMDDKGNFYGTTKIGGSPKGDCPGSTCGTVFQLSPPKKKGDAWKETVLYSFCSQSGCTDGADPRDKLVLDKQGSLYGTTTVGGDLPESGCPQYGFAFGCGVVFKLSHTKNGWQESVLYTFTGGTDGGYPYGGVILDNKGNLYGTTYGYGGSNEVGVVYELKHSKKNWTQETLYAFTAGSDGALPAAPVILDVAGNLYGTTQAGAAGYGTVFELVHSKNAWTEKTLYAFTGGSDGGSPLAPVVKKGNSLYGTTYAGGNNSNCYYGCGSVFQLTNTKSGWTENTLYLFQGGSGDGAEPINAVVLDKKGILYGTTLIGGEGPYGAYGTVYQIKP